MTRTHPPRAQPLNQCRTTRQRRCTCAGRWRESPALTPKGSAKDLIARFNSQEFNSDKDYGEKLAHPRDAPPRPKAGATSSCRRSLSSESGGEAPTSALDAAAQSPDGCDDGTGDSFTARTNLSQDGVFPQRCYVLVQRTRSASRD